MGILKLVKVYKEELGSSNTGRLVRSSSVMQSNGDSFWGDDALDCFNMAYETKAVFYTNKLKCKSSGILILKILYLNSA